MLTDFNQLVNAPAGLALGTDLAHYDVNVDWAAIVAAGINFVYIKVSDGIGTPDAMANKHATDAKNNGLRIGYYHFCRPKLRGGTVAEAATAEANDTIHLLSALPTADLPLVLDLEDQQPWDSPFNPQDYLLWVNTFIDTFPGGTDFMIYSRKEYLDQKLPANHGLGKYALWLSRYTSDANLSACPKGWDNWAIWQFTEEGIIGNSKNLDLNIGNI